MLEYPFLPYYCCLEFCFQSFTVRNCFLLTWTEHTHLQFTCPLCSVSHTFWLPGCPLMQEGTSPVSRGDVEEREAKSRVSACCKRPLFYIYIFQTPCLNVRSYWWKRKRVKHYSWTLFLMIMSYVTFTCSKFAMSKSVLWSQSTQFRFYNEIASWPLSSSSLILLPLSCVIFFFLIV